MCALCDISQRNLLNSFQVWEDEFLKWDSEKYQGLDEIILSANKVWTPTIGFANRFVLNLLPKQVGFSNIKYLLYRLHYSVICITCLSYFCCVISKSILFK